MKRFLLTLILITSISCSDQMYEMYDDLTMKVPICVDASAAPGGDGRGWANAFNTIQEAVEAAQPGDEIWVAGTQDITSTVNIDKPLRLYGGFIGIESRRDQRDFENNKAELSGGVQLIDIDVAGGVVFDGFSVSGGTGSSISISSNSIVHVENCFFGDGRGINVAGELFVRDSEFKNRTEDSHFFLQGVSFTAESCIFANNDAAAPVIYAEKNIEVIIKNSHFENNSNNTGNGGAINVSYGATLTIKDSAFGKKDVPDSGNTAHAGGAIYANGSDVTIDNSEFYSNTATTAGGAVFANENSTVIIENSKFEDNYSGSVGGAINISGSELYLSNSSFYNNQSGNGGGALRFRSLANGDISTSRFFANSSGTDGGAVYFEGSSLNITNSELSNNIAGTGGSGSGSGGAIYVESGETTISACKFISNEAPIDNMANGGGAVYFNQINKSTIVNSYFYDNSAYWGGAVYIGGGLGESYEHAFVNLTFYANSANMGDGGTGGAIFMRSVCDVYNSVFYMNMASLGKNIVRSDSPATPPDYNIYNCYFDGGMGDGLIAHNCIDSSANPFASTNPGSSNFLYPAAGSGLINNGTDDFSDSPISGHFTRPATDLAGNPRVSGGAIDIGAYERQ